eukprot:m.619474 g.619474  ORF g.619474 m.619474 type:complete len:95 (+) comp22530_c0_seq27:3059-3343(+)
MSSFQHSTLAWTLSLYGNSCTCIRDRIGTRLMPACLPTPTLTLTTDPYFAEYHDVEDEPVSESPFQVDSEIDDDADLETLTARIDEEVSSMADL